MSRETEHRREHGEVPEQGAGAYEEPDEDGRLFDASAHPFDMCALGSPVYRRLHPSALKRLFSQVWCTVYAIHCTRADPCSTARLRR